VGAEDPTAVPAGPDSDPAMSASGGDGADGGDDSPEEDRFWSDEPEPEKSRDLQSQLRTLVEWVAVAVGALAVALLIKAFLLQAFYIPTASMDPTLVEDDRVLVNKLSYRVGDVQRGDIIVFHRPEGAPGTIDDFIKRVIALPGETISFSDGTVFVDGRSLIEDYVHGAPTNSDQVIPGCDTTPAVSDTCQVPAGMVFVMGDNRVASWDSRRFGPIGESTIVGRAFLKVWPLGDIGFL
jgi:signal peptidase I